MDQTKFKVIKRGILLLLVCGIATVGSAQGLLISRLRPGANPTAIAQQYGITYKDWAPNAPFYLYFVPPPLNVHTVQAAMMTNPDVVWAEDDARVTMPESVGGGKGGTVAVINDRGRAQAANAGALTQVGFSQAFTQSAGRLVRIAVLDTGLSPSCSILWAKTAAQYNAIGSQGMAYDMARGVDSNANGVPDEGVGHGTFVAGVIDQLSPSSRLVVVRIADSDGNATAWSLIKGISYAVKTGCEVANISMGSSRAIPALGDVLEWARLSGTFCVAASGNENAEMVYDPAGISKVLAVTGIDSRNVKATFANYEGKIEACAPAVGIRSYGPLGQMMIWSGTSFAAPFVSGALVECLRHFSVRVDTATIYGVLKSSGKSVDDVNPNYRKKLGLKLWIPDMWDKLRAARLP